MMELKRTYTADQLEEMGALDDTHVYAFGHRLARDGEDEHRWYVLWRYVFEDTSDSTTWAIHVAEAKGEEGDLSWWYIYDDRNKIEAYRVDSRQVLTTEWFEVSNG